MPHSRRMAQERGSFLGPVRDPKRPIFPSHIVNSSFSCSSDAPHFFRYLDLLLQALIFRELVSQECRRARQQISFDTVSHPFLYLKSVPAAITRLRAILRLGEHCVALGRCARDWVFQGFVIVISNRLPRRGSRVCENFCQVLQRFAMFSKCILLLLHSSS